MHPLHVGIRKSVKKPSASSLTTLLDARKPRLQSARSGLLRRLRGSAAAFSGSELAVFMRMAGRLPSTSSQETLRPVAERRGGGAARLALQLAAGEGGTQIRVGGGVGEIEPVDETGELAAVARLRIRRAPPAAHGEVRSRREPRGKRRRNGLSPHLLAFDHRRFRARRSASRSARGRCCARRRAFPALGRLDE